MFLTKRVLRRFDVAGVLTLARAGGCTTIWGLFTNDADGDAIVNNVDNCPFTANPNQADGPNRRSCRPWGSKPVSRFPLRSSPLLTQGSIVRRT